MTIANPKSSQDSRMRTWTSSSPWELGPTQSSNLLLAKSISTHVIPSSRLFCPVKLQNPVSGGRPHWPYTKLEFHLLQQLTLSNSISASERNVIKCVSVKWVRARNRSMTPGSGKVLGTFGPFCSEMKRAESPMVLMIEINVEFLTRDWFQQWAFSKSNILVKRNLFMIYVFGEGITFS